ncbi:hypothetical protein QOL99_12140 [Deinococcus sp. MIMF12]|uniref:Uncharacterized protein n=1 Tax=Deinococcus rhizophilus TaxID=3049544 RepID=A0ABT7JIL3_9DEIO|nr:hypothetical protein [Deinococcus rhizophilus]MDL2344895.1 hypothetical protein [Deinococcus rhizophilus]
MSTPVPLAPAEAPPALRPVTLGVPLLLAGAAFLPDGGRALPHPELLAAALLTGLGFGLAPQTFGTRLPGDLTGHFTFGPDPAVRRVRAAATRNSGGVLLESGGRTHCLTPADPDRFPEALARRGARVEA